MRAQAKRVEDPDWLRFLAEQEQCMHLRKGPVLSVEARERMRESARTRHKGGVGEGAQHGS